MPTIEFKFDSKVESSESIENSSFISTKLLILKHGLYKDYPKSSFETYFSDDCKHIIFKIISREEDYCSILEDFKDRTRGINYSINKLD